MFLESKLAALLAPLGLKALGGIIELRKSKDSEDIHAAHGLELCKAHIERTAVAQAKLEAGLGLDAAGKVTAAADFLIETQRVMRQLMGILAQLAKKQVDGDKLVTDATAEAESAIKRLIAAYFGDGDKAQVASPAERLLISEVRSAITPQRATESLDAVRSRMVAELEADGITPDVPPVPPADRSSGRGAIPWTPPAAPASIPSLGPKETA